MSEHLTPQEIIYSPEQYWNDPRVVRAMLQFMDGKGTSWQDVDSVSHEFLGWATEEKALSHKKSPVSTFAPAEIEDRIRSTGGRGELSVSYLQKKEDLLDQPRRVLFCWDIDRFKIKSDNNYDEPYLIHNPVDAFGHLDGIYDLYRDFFNAYGIPFISVSSGKGYHFFTQVAHDDVIAEIQQIGNVIEDTVQQRLLQSHNWSKAPGPVPVYNEQAFKGSCRIQQWVNSQLAREARTRTILPVEIWDKGFPNRETDGIALDNTPALFTVNTKMIAALGSPYFIKAVRSGAPLNRIILQLPMEGNDFHYDWKDLLAKRYSFTQSAELLEQTNCSIPDGSAGMQRLIHDYYQTDLRRLHEAMDSSMGDDPSSFDSGYRKDNYEAIIHQTKDPNTVRNTIRFANPMLVQNRYAIDHLVYQVFHAMGGNRNNVSAAPHVAGLMRAIYEDPKYGWSDSWSRHVDVQRWARGTVEQVLGQMFEK